MTDTGCTQPPSAPLTMLEHALRAASRADHDLADMSSDSPNYVAAVTVWHTKWVHAAWREIHHSHLARGHAGDDGERRTVADYTDAILVASQWADDLANHCGITIEPGNDPVSQVVYRGIIASFVWLIARDGQAAAHVIYRECVTDAVAAQDGHASRPEEEQ